MNEHIVEKSIITPEVIAKALTYEQYYSLIKQLLKEGKTTGNNQSDSYLKYAKLNFQRMKRVYRTTKIENNLLTTVSGLSQKQIWIVLTEGWCGDAAQSLPAIAKISELTDKIELRILLRDENFEIMNAYRTNGSKSIPKLIALDSENLDQLFTWGPRPEEFQEMVMQHIKNPQLTNAEFNEKLHMKYTLNKTKSLQTELTKLISSV